MDDSSLARYISSCSIYHIEAAWDHNWSTDEHACNNWLADYPQDFVVEAAAEYLGFEKCSQLALQAQSTSDTFKFAKLCSAAGLCARTVDSQAGVLRSLELEISAIDALGALKDQTPEVKDHCERLELEMLSKLFGLLDPAYFRFLPREWPYAVNWLHLFTEFDQI